MKKRTTKSVNKALLTEIVRKHMYIISEKGFFETKKSYTERVEGCVRDTVEKICLQYKLCKKRS